MDAALCATVFAEWHGPPEPNVRPRKWQALGDVLPKLMQRLGLSERLHETEVIEVCEKSSPTHCLTFIARQHALGRALCLWPSVPRFIINSKASQPAILRKLRRRLGGKIIRDFRFRLGK